jgi:hypothetical protein
LNGEGSSASEPPSLSFDFGVRRTFAIEPPDACACPPYPLWKLAYMLPSTVLARVQQFLPQIEQSNAELSQRDPRSIDIEHIEETDGRVIEMASAQQRDYKSSSRSLTWKGNKTNRKIRTWDLAFSSNGERESIRPQARPLQRHPPEAKATIRAIRRRLPTRTRRPLRLQILRTTIMETDTLLAHGRYAHYRGVPVP